MIFVTVGNHNQPFNRLLQWIDEIARERIFSERFFVQRGHTKLALASCESVDFLDSQEFDACLAQAVALVTHAGQGTIFASLAAGLTPVVVPRLKRFNEHTNDHQLQIALAFEQQGLIRVAHTRDELTLHLSAVLQAKRRPKRHMRPNERLLSIVRSYLDAVAAQLSERWH